MRIIISRPVSTTLSRSKKRNIETATSSFLNKAASALQSKADESDGFGVLTASKHRRMTDQQKELAEILVLQVLSKGLRGELTTKSRLTEEQQAIPYQPMHYSQSRPSNHQAAQWQYSPVQGNSFHWSQDYTNL